MQGCICTPIIFLRVHCTPIICRNLLAEAGIWVSVSETYMLCTLNSPRDAWYPNDFLYFISKINMFQIPKVMQFVMQCDPFRISWRTLRMRNMSELTYERRRQRMAGTMQRRVDAGNNAWTRWLKRESGAPAGRRLIWERVFAHVGDYTGWRTVVTVDSGNFVTGFGGLINCLLDWFLARSLVSIVVVPDFKDR